VTPVCAIFLGHNLSQDCLIGLAGGHLPGSQTFECHSFGAHGGWYFDNNSGNDLALECLPVFADFKVGRVLAVRRK
jgi:hypothetical protein